MLQSACCSNYLCILCVKDLKNREIKEPTFYITCPYKCIVEGKFKLADVPETDQVKRYTDSQYMSFFSNNLAAKGAQKSMLASQNLGGSAASGFGGWNVDNKKLGPAF